MNKSTNIKLKKITSVISITAVAASLSILTPIGIFAYSVNAAYSNLQNLKVDEAATNMKHAVFFAKYCPDSDKKTASGLNILSTLLLAQGNLNDAESIIEQSLKLQSKTSEEELQIIPSLVAKAELYRRQAKLSEAINLYKRILFILSKSGQDNRLSAQIKRDLGILLFIQEDYPKAEKELKSIDRLYKKLSLNTVNNVIDLNLHFGMLSEAKGKYKTAMEFYDHAEQLYKEHPTGKNSLAALIYNLKAELYLNQNDIEKSEPLITKAFSLSQDLTSVERLQAGNLRCLLNLTSLYIKEAKFDPR